MAIACMASFFVASFAAGTAAAGEVRVAVAANFAGPMRQIAGQFERESGHTVHISLGATGAFYAQIRHGAPYDVLLAADDDVPARLEREGAAVAGSRFTYAVGRLVLWSAKAGIADAGPEALRKAAFSHLAIANPRLAPYGRAAAEALAALGLADAMAARLVQAENIGQAYQFVASGNAQLGFVAMSQVYEDGRLRSGSAWIVPENLHAPIRQDAVLLEKGREQQAAQALMRYLRGESSRRTMRRYGYAH